jgi:hypothetical protein
MRAALHLPYLLLAFTTCADLRRPLSAQEASEAAPSQKDARKDARGVRPSRAGSSLLELASAELREIQRETRELRAQALEKRRTEHDRLKDIAAERRALERRLEALAAQVAKRETERDEKKTALEAAKKERQELEARAKELVGLVASYLERVETRVDRGIPWNVAGRKQSVSDARKTTVDEDASASAAVLAASRVQQEEEALGRLVESGKVTVEAGGESQEVFAFHLGLLGVVFANEEGTVIGFAQAGETLEDGLGAASASPEAAEGYLAAVDILRRRRSPSAVDLWIPRLKVRKEAE